MEYLENYTLRHCSHLICDAYLRDISGISIKSQIDNFINDYSKFGKVTIVSNNTVFGFYIQKVTVKCLVKNMIKIGCIYQNKKFTINQVVLDWLTDSWTKQYVNYNYINAIGQVRWDVTCIPG